MEKDMYSILEFFQLSETSDCLVKFGTLEEVKKHSEFLYNYWQGEFKEKEVTINYEENYKCGGFCICGDYPLYSIEVRIEKVENSFKDKE